MKNPEKYRNPFGIWTVTTEGDVEGRSVRHLGTFEGHIADIAFKLADQCYYSLKFRKADEKRAETMPRRGTRVHITLDIGSGTWDMTREKRAQFIQELVGPEVRVKEGTYYASALLIDGEDEEEEARKRDALARQAALEKLTEEERKLLGLEK